MSTSKSITFNTNNFLFLILLVFTLYILQSLIVPLLYAIMLSILLFPLVDFLERKCKMTKVFSAIIAILVLLIFIIFLFLVIGSQLSDVLAKSSIYANKLEQMYNQTIKQLETNYNFNIGNLTNGSIDIGKALKDNFSNIMQLIGTSGSIISDMILIPIYMFFFLIYRYFFQTFLLKVFGKNENNSTVNFVLNKLYDVQKNYLTGLFTVMGIVGLLNSVGLLILGIENAFFYGFLAALLLLIPYIGIIIGSIIPAIIALVTKDSYFYAIAVIGLFSFVQFLEGNFITPKITGSKININALVVIISIIAFSMLWGTSGMILALPVIASLKVVFDNIPSLEPYGFILGEPKEEHTQSNLQLRWLKWLKIRKSKNS